MRNIFLLIVIAAIGFMVACSDHDTLPAYATTTIFNTSSVMTHDKDTIKSGLDTIKISASGGIADTTRKYAISASLKATDTVSGYLVGAEYIKSISVSFDTVNFYKTKLFRWTSTMSLPLASIPAKTRIKTTAFFTYGLNLSSQTGNQTGTDNKAVYAK